MAANKRKSPTNYAKPTRQELNTYEKDLVIKANLNWEIRYIMFETATHETKYKVILAICSTGEAPISVNSPTYS